MSETPSGEDCALPVVFNPWQARGALHEERWVRIQFDEVWDLRPSVTMTAAEFRVARERLNVSGEWLAARLGVALRTVRRWEAGASPLNAGVEREVLALLDATEAFVQSVVQTLRQEGPDDSRTGGWQLLVFLDDATYFAHHPDGEWSASWHRAAMGRVAEQVPEVSLEWAPSHDTSAS
ncbi:DNA-binding transcriptional regulator [Dermacoccus sp. Tok2021]|uniref:helix-turn-helix domain-containing protein n=1 Tax=Dermacoccus sp. Tok2021 TaxID=2826873 RepID=UPI001CA75DAE|nr:hypothetical protein [Dermacoccus sp. Tok2021]MBZ4497952.1 hypothetical protein [Dermacoccus sp. Tok2021]